MASQDRDWEATTGPVLASHSLADLEARLLGLARRNAVQPSQAVVDEMERQEAQRLQQVRERRRRRGFAERRRARLFETEEERRQAEEAEEDYGMIAEMEGWVKVELTDVGVRKLWEELRMRPDDDDVIWVRWQPK